MSNLMLAPFYLVSQFSSHILNNPARLASFQLNELIQFLPIIVSQCFVLFFFSPSKETEASLGISSRKVFNTGI